MKLSLATSNLSGGAAAADLRRPAHLAIEGATVVYEASRGPLKALDSVSLTVGKGEFVSVLGPSGCGKSTLLRIVAGLMRVTEGAIRLDGAVVDGPRRDIGMVFQQPTLLPWRTVLDNVLVPIRAMSGDVRAATDRAIQLLELVGLADFREHYPWELSGGMQQRVGIARGLIHDPPLLLMDEPFAALDAMTREQMMAELQRIWMGTGKSVLFITHSIPEAVFLSDSVIVLSGRPGRVIHEVRIDLPRPRSEVTMANKDFAEHVLRLRNCFSAMSGH